MKDDSVSRAAVLNLIEQSCCDLEYDCDNVALRKEVEALPSAQPGWTTDVNDILAYLDGVVHPLVSPENWNVYSELHDMVSGLLEPWEGEKP